MEGTIFKIKDEDVHVSGLLWREDLSLPSNYEMAKKRLLYLEKKFENNARIKGTYIKKGYVKKPSEEEVQMR